MLDIYDWRVVALFEQIEIIEAGPARSADTDARAPEIETDADKGLNPESLVIDCAGSWGFVGFRSLQSV
jgi:hypothetical protein